jgi:very-short-patch-repair endonuclease
VAKDAELIERAKSMRREPSPFEQKLWLALRAKRLSGAKFRRQQVIGTYIADFACRIPKMLVIEVDGDTHAHQKAYDKNRTTEFERRGYRVLRFTNRDVGSNLEGVLMTIANAVALPLSPTLSPEGERG